MSTDIAVLLDIDVIGDVDLLLDHNGDIHIGDVVRRTWTIIATATPITRRGTIQVVAATNGRRGRRTARQELRQAKCIYSYVAANRRAVASKDTTLRGWRRNAGAFTTRSKDLLPISRISRYITAQGGTVCSKTTALFNYGLTSPRTRVCWTTDVA
jgi:hypothetical protein